MDGYEPGDVILKSEPFAYVLSNKHRGKRCDSCLKVNESLKRCSQCSVLYFCDRICQKKAWKFHKEECPHLKLLPEEPLEFDLLVARVILRLKRDGCEAYEEVMSHRRTFDSLTSHVEELKEQPETMLRFSRLCKALLSFLKPDLLPPPQELLNIFGKVLVNSYGIYDQELLILGSGLYLGASILDHSCHPNAVFTFTGSSLSVRAICSIPAPKEDVTQVFISYIDQVQRTEDRRAQLRDQYFFVCSCDWCTSDCMETYMTQTLNHEAEAASLVTELKQVFDRDGELEEPFERGLDTLGPECTLGPFHVLRSQLLALLFDAAINLQRWEEVVSIGTQSLPIFRLYLGKFSPSLGVVLLKIGKVLLFLERLDQAREILLQAEEVLSVTHGRDSNIYATLLELSLNVP